MIRARNRLVTFKDIAGSLVAFVVVVSYAAIGFAAMGAKVLLNVEVTPPEVWTSGLSSLASAALGYLIGRNDVPATPTYVPPALPPSASACNMPGCPMNTDGPTHESS